MATARSVLVVTATSEFGESIQHMLEQTGLYKVMVVDSEQEALLCIQTVAFTIAILDADLPGGNILALASTMRQRLPRMRLVMLCAEDDPSYPAVMTFKPSGILNKPFYFPDLLDTLSRVLQFSNEPDRKSPSRSSTNRPILDEPAAPPAPEWLQDADWAARNLTQLSLESSAQAALIVREGVLWAYAGELDQSAANELAEGVSSLWEADADSPAPTPDGGRRQAGDMVRFIHLDATQSEYMLYMTSLGRGMMLSLVFETETPFSTIRAQAGYLAKALAAPPGSPLPASPKPVQYAYSNAFVNKVNSSATKNQVQPILEDVPPPTPRQSHKKFEENNRAPTWFEEASFPASLTEAGEQQKKATVLTPDELGSGKKPRDLPPLPADNIGTRMDEQPIYDPVPAKDHELLPVSPTLHYLTCSCTLIPRFPQHRLIGELAQLIQEWIPQLFLAFGWQLLHLNMLPEYMLVIARVAPNTAPGSLVRIIRQQTSRRILNGFPHIAQEIPSHDFWAPGYLILSSSQPPPNHMLRHFIEQTRLQQGAHKNG